MERGVALGKIRFDPPFILSQILVIQASYYLVLGGCLYASETFINRVAGMDLVFDTEMLGLHTALGVIITACHFIPSVTGALSLSFVVGRSKQCLDYALTLYFFHLLLCTINFSFPHNAVWWMLLLVNISTMTLISEYLCMKKELREIAMQNVDEPHIQQTGLVQKKEREIQAREMEMKIEIK
eukprot:TRINITY_DN102_c5_g1_i1.p1 TRINITY_DN102_c5_g1~~TRINITY_DN102_c5_g1_i1.p1  ORF type:complete len:199 (+),score=27.63 TRINITY_DN102_c5_g1_i1:51-599(+)